MNKNTEYNELNGLFGTKRTTNLLSAVKLACLKNRLYIKKELVHSNQKNKNVILLVSERYKLILSFTNKSGEWIINKIKIYRRRFSRWITVIILAISIFASEFFGFNQPISSEKFLSQRSSTIPAQICVLNSSHKTQIKVLDKIESDKNTKEVLSNMVELVLSLRAGEPLPGADGFTPRPLRKMSPYGLPRVNRSNSFTPPPGPSGVPGQVGRAATGISAKKSVQNNNGNGGNSEQPLTKEQRRNLYTDGSSVFEIANGESNVVHPGQTGFKTKSHGKLAGLEVNDKQRALSTKENKSSFHNYVVNDAKRLGADENKIYPNVEYTTRNQPTQPVNALFDKKTNTCHLFKQKVDEKGNHPWVTVMKLDDDQRDDLLENNSIGSHYKDLHETKANEE